MTQLMNGTDFRHLPGPYTVATRTADSFRSEDLSQCTLLATETLEGYFERQRQPTLLLTFDGVETWKTMGKLVKSAWAVPFDITSMVFYHILLQRDDILADGPSNPIHTLHLGQLSTRDTPRLHIIDVWGRICKLNEAQKVAMYSRVQVLREKNQVVMDIFRELLRYQDAYGQQLDEMSILALEPTMYRSLLECGTVEHNIPIEDSPVTTFRRQRLAGPSHCDLVCVHDQ